MVVAWTYAVAVNFVPAYTITMDKVGESTVGIDAGSKDEEAMGEADESKKVSTAHIE